MIKRFMLSFINFYRKEISPLKGTGVCRFTPTCSAYALEAIEKHGAFKGGFMSFWRIMRCNPWTKGGHDPVPEPKAKNKKKTPN